MRYAWLLLLFIPLLTGCARFPASTAPSDTPPRTIYSEITVAGQINPSYYYFLALDTDGDPANGPIPVVTGLEQGTGWGTISGLGPNSPIQQPPFFVMYNNGTFQQNLNGRWIGPPYRAEADATHLRVEIDLRQIVEEGQSIPSIVQLNWITMRDLVIRPQDIGYIKEYDGFGPRGNDFLSDVPTDQSWRRYAGDEYGTPREDVPSLTAPDTPDIALIGWDVQTRLRQVP